MRVISRLGAWEPEGRREGREGGKEIGRGVRGVRLRGRGGKEIQ